MAAAAKSSAVARLGRRFARRTAAAVRSAGVVQVTRMAHARISGRLKASGWRR